MKKKRKKKCNDDDNWEVFSLIKLVWGTLSHILIHFQRGDHFLSSGEGRFSPIFYFIFSLILKYVWWLSHHTPLSVTQNFSYGKSTKFHFLPIENIP